MNKDKGKITLDWGAIFDILSIYNVKINQCFSVKRESNILNFKELELEIKSQIGELRFNEIIRSPEYQDLYGANLSTFKKIEESQSTIGLAKEVDSLNYERFLKKSALHRKFFGNNISEIKIGYDK